MSNNRYYKSFKSFNEKNTSVSQGIVDKAKADEKARQQNIKEFSAQYEKDILNPARKARKGGQNVWNDAKDGLYQEVLNLLKFKEISDLSVFNRNIGNKKDEAHKYFLERIAQDAEAKRITAENAEKEAEEKARLQAEKDKADTDSKITKDESDSKETSKETTNALNVSTESQIVADKIRTDKKTIQLSTSLVSKVLPEVKLVQEIYNDKGATLKIDGRFGKNSKAYTIKYQENANILVNGVVDNDTWKSLLSIEENLEITKPVVKAHTSSSSSTDTGISDNEVTTNDFTKVKVGDTGKVNTNDISFNITEGVINEADNYDTDIEKEEKSKLALLKSIEGTYDYEIKDGNIINIKAGDSGKDFMYTLEDGKINIDVTTKELKELKSKLAYKMILKKYPSKTVEKKEKMKDGSKRDVIMFDSSYYGQVRYYTDNTFRQILNGTVNFEGTYYFNDSNVLKLKWKDDVSKANAKTRKESLSSTNEKSLYDVKKFISLCVDKFPDDEYLVKMNNSENGVISLTGDGYKDIYGYYYYYVVGTWMSFSEDAWLDIFDKCDDDLLWGFINTYNNEKHHYEDSEKTFNFLVDSDSGFENSELNQLKDIIRTKGMDINGTTITKK